MNTQLRINAAHGVSGIFSSWCAKGGLGRCSSRLGTPWRWEGRGDGRTHLIFLVCASVVRTASGEGERRSSGEDDERKYQRRRARAECAKQEF